MNASEGTGGAGSAVGRIQWSRLAITIYDGSGAFVCRIEHEADRMLFNQFVIEGLKQIDMRQQKRAAEFKLWKEQHADTKQGANESHVLRGTGQGNEGQGSSVGSGDAEHQTVAGANQAETEIKEVTGEAV